MASSRRLNAHQRFDNSPHSLGLGAQGLPVGRSSSHRDCGRVLQLPVRSGPKSRTLGPKKIKVRKANRQYAALMLELGGLDATKKFELLEILRTSRIGSPQSKLSWFEKRSLVGMICDNSGKTSGLVKFVNLGARDNTQEFSPELEQIRSCADCIRTVIRGSSSAYTKTSTSVDQLPSSISRPTPFFYISTNTQTYQFVP